MDHTTFERLLFKPEGASLDFKRDQYKLTNNDEKSELVKDVLAFANTSRECEAFILIGVNDGKGSKATLKGIDPSEQLDDANLQQLVNGKTNRPVEFVYEPFVHSGLTFGVFRIAVQDGLRYLEQDFGKLKRNHLYVRRGSSTCLLTPDEIFALGAASRAQESPQLELQFVGWPDGENFGSEIVLNRRRLIFPPKLPTLDEVTGRKNNTSIRLGDRLFEIPSITGHSEKNISFVSEMVEYGKFCNLYLPLTFAIANSGTSAALGVSFHIEAACSGLTAIDEESIPEPPELNSFARLNFGRTPSVISQFEVKVDSSIGRVEITSSPVDIPPGKTHQFNNGIYFGCERSSEAVFKGKLYANNLPYPSEVQMHLEFEVKDRAVSKDEIALAYQTYQAGGREPELWGWD